MSDSTSFSSPPDLETFGNVVVGVIIPVIVTESCCQQLVGGVSGGKYPVVCETFSQTGNCPTHPAEKQNGAVSCLCPLHLLSPWPEVPLLDLHLGNAYISFEFQF